MDIRPKKWLWVVIVVGIFLIAIALWFVKQQNNNLAQIEHLAFKSEVVNKFSNFTDNQTNDTSSPLTKILICTAKSFSTERLDLSEGYYAIFTANCYYKDANGREQFVKLPLVVTDGVSLVISGYELKDYDSVYEELGTEEAWNGHLSNIGFTGRGHIFTPTLEPANPSSGVYGTFRGLGATAMARYYSDQDFANFATSGDPRYLNGILWTPDVGLINGLNNITPERLPNITPS